jgi:hypothetical protein
MVPPSTFVNRARILLRAALYLILVGCLASLSLRAEWITYGIKVPLPYIEEPVYDTASETTYYTYEDQGEATVTGYWVDTDNSSFTSILYFGNAYAAIDAVAVQSAGNGGFIWLTPQPYPGGYEQVVRFLLSPTISNHTFALAQRTSSGAVYNTPLSISSYVWLNDDGTGSPNYVPKATATYDPTRPFWAVDLTDRKKAPEGNTDLRGVSFQPDYSQYPLVEVSLYLEGREIGHKFTVYSWADGGPTMAASATAIPSSVSGSINGYLIVRK